MALHYGSQITVIGGSLVGPLCALLLGRAGFRNLQVYEAFPAVVQQAGGVIDLDWHSLALLEEIGIEQGEIIPFPSSRIVNVKIVDRREVGRSQVCYPGRATTWRLLHKALVSRLPQHSLHLGKRVTGISGSDDGRAVLSFADGESAWSDFTIFADGRKSTGRKLLDSERALQYTGYIAVRGEVDACPDMRDFMRYESSVPGWQFNAFPILSKGGIGTDWTLYQNLNPDQFREWFGGSPTSRTFVLPYQVSKQARDAILRHAEHLPDELCRLVHEAVITAIPVVSVAPPTRMVYEIAGSHAVLLGDALAPARAHTAKGANHGFLQASGLVQILHQHSKYGLNLDATLRDWQKRHLGQVTTTLQDGETIARKLKLGN